MIRMVKLFMIFILLGGIWGCSNKSDADETASKTPQSSTLRVQLSWVHSHEYAGMYMAQDLGYYADEKLTVQLDELGEKYPLDALLDGETDFAIVGADEVLLARAAGKPIVAVATIFQRSPIGFISLAENQILNPADLVGKTIYLSTQSSSEYSFRAMLSNAGVNVGDVNLVSRTEFTNDKLLSGEVDVMDVWVNNQPVELEAEGHQLNTLMPFDYGVELYPNLLVTTESMIENNAEVVAHFVKSTVRGLQAAVDDPEKAATAVLERNPDLNLAFEQDSMLRSVPLINPSESRPGTMTANSWAVTANILQDQGLLAEGIELEKAYTIRFLE